MPAPPLIPLDADEALVASKLEGIRNLSTERILKSLEPGAEHALRARPDGTILNGHHRLKILRERGVDVNDLPREVLPKAAMPDLG